MVSLFRFSIIKVSSVVTVSTSQPHHPLPLPIGTGLRTKLFGRTLCGYLLILTKWCVRRNRERDKKIHSRATSWREAIPWLQQNGCVKDLFMYYLFDGVERFYPRVLSSKTTSQNVRLFRSISLTHHQRPAHVIFIFDCCAESPQKGPETIQQFDIFKLYTHSKLLFWNRKCPANMLHQGGIGIVSSAYLLHPCHRPANQQPKRFIDQSWQSNNIPIKVGVGRKAKKGILLGCWLWMSSKQDPSQLKKAT